MTVDELLTKHRRMPETTVRRLNVAPVYRDECESAAWFALYQCALRFDSTRGAAFQTFAFIRLRGVVLDTVRTLRNAERCNTAAHAEAAYCHPISMDQQIDLDRALAGSLPEDRDLLVGYYIDGLKQHELGKSKSWNSRRLKRALDRARELAR